MKRALKMFIPAALLLVGGRAPATEESVLKERNETQEQRDARMQWFREARFGMFIHWGPYAVAAGEWKGKPSGGAPSPMTGESLWIFRKKIPDKRDTVIRLELDKEPILL